MWETLSKFGLKHCDLPTMMWNVTTMLRMIALNIDPRQGPVSPFAYLFLAVISVSYYYVYFISMLWFVFWRCRETGDLLSAIVVFSLGVSSEISMTKFICLCVYRKSVRKIVGAYLACDATVEPDSRLAVNMRTTLRDVKKRVIFVWSVIIWNGIIYVVKPLIMKGRHFMEDAFIFLGFEPMTESPKYEVALTMNILGVFVTCFPVANVTSFFIIAVGYTEAQMLALSEELKNLWSDALKDQNSEAMPERDNANTKEREKEINKSVRKRLEVILKRHTTNINLLRQVETVFRIAIAIEFILLVMGIIAELLGGLENTWIEMPFALMLVGADCFTGQRIIDASLVFEKAVYDCKWENFDVANRKIVMLMLQNSQKGMRLSAGGVATLSLECLMSVNRTTYSAYTTLRSTVK